MPRTDRLRVLVYAAFVVGALLAAFPHPRVGRPAQARLAPLYDLTAGVQGWAMFAPNPGTTAPHLRVELHASDGTIEIYEPLVPPQWQLLRDRRWEKVSKEMVSNENYELWQPLAENLASDAEDRGMDVVDVVLVRVTNLDPGRGNDGEPTEITTPIFSLDEGILATDSQAEPAAGGFDG